MYTNSNSVYVLSAPYTAVCQKLLGYSIDIHN